MTIKDTFEVLGMPCTAGASTLRDHRPRKSAAAVKRLEDAGAIVFGKTNVPAMAGDIQTYKPPVRHHPQPLEPGADAGWFLGGRGGGVGGGFYAAGTGQRYWRLYSDPGALHRVYGHKPTYGLVPQRGHIPGAPGELAEGHLNVVGPLARNAADLQVLLDVIAGGQVQLPAPRRATLKAFRVLLWTEDADCPLDSDMIEAYRQLRLELEAAGVEVVQGAPAGASLERLFGGVPAAAGRQVGCVAACYPPPLQWA